MAIFFTFEYYHIINKMTEGRFRTSVTVYEPIECTCLLLQNTQHKDQIKKDIPLAGICVYVCVFFLCLLSSKGTFPQQLPFSCFAVFYCIVVVEEPVAHWAVSASWWAAPAANMHWKRSYYTISTWIYTHIVLSSFWSYNHPVWLQMVFSSSFFCAQILMRKSGTAKRKENKRNEGAKDNGANQLIGFEIIGSDKLWHVAPRFTQMLMSWVMHYLFVCWCVIGERESRFEGLFLLFHSQTCLLCRTKDTLA